MYRVATVASVDLGSCGVGVWVGSSCGLWRTPRGAPLLYLRTLTSCMLLPQHAAAVKAAVRIQASLRAKLARYHVAIARNEANASHSHSKLQTVAAARSVAQRAVDEDTAGHVYEAVKLYRESLNDIRDNLALVRNGKTHSHCGVPLDLAELLHFKKAYQDRIEELLRGLDGESGTADAKASVTQNAQRVVHANTSDDRLTEADMLRTLRDLGFGLTDDELLEVLRRVGVGSLTFDEFTAMLLALPANLQLSPPSSVRRRRRANEANKSYERGYAKGRRHVEGLETHAKQRRSRSRAKAVARSKEASTRSSSVDDLTNSRGRTEDVAWRDRLHENWKELVKLREASVTASSSSRPLLVRASTGPAGTCNCCSGPRRAADRHGVRGASTRS